MKRFAKESEMRKGIGRARGKGKGLGKQRFFLFFFLTYTFALFCLFSCKGKETTQVGKQGPVYNPYSTESVYLETKQRLEAHPEDAEAWFHLANLYEGNGQYAEAIDAYKKVAKLRPSQGFVYVKIGTSYDQIGKPREAVEAFKKAVHYMPGFAVAYNNLGIAYGKLGRNREEIAALKKALQLRPRYVTARYNLGIAYLRVKDKKAALQQYELLKDVETGAADALKKEIDSSGN